MIWFGFRMPSCTNLSFNCEDRYLHHNSNMSIFLSNIVITMHLHNCWFVMYFFRDINEAARSFCVQAAVKVKGELQGKGESGSQKGKDDKSFQHDVPWPCSWEGQEGIWYRVSRVCTDRISGPTYGSGFNTKSILTNKVTEAFCSQTRIYSIHRWHCTMSF